MELPLTITDLECGEYTESHRGNEALSDYLQVTLDLEFVFFFLF